MDTNQRRDAPDIKTHEEILSMLHELDILEDRIRNLPVTQADVNEDNLILQEVEQTEPYIEIVTDPSFEVPTETIRHETLPKKRPISLFEHHHPQHDRVKKTRHHHRTSHDKQHTAQLPGMHTHRRLWKRNITQRPVSSTFALHITEVGALAGLDMQRPKPPKPQIRLFGRHQKTEAETQETLAPGFKGKMKRAVAKIVHRRSKDTEGSAGIGSKIKGIFRRRPKEQQ